MAAPCVTNNSNLWIGEILKAARLRSGMTRQEVAVAAGCRSGERIAGLWETDTREIGGHATTPAKVMQAYQLTDDEKQEVTRRISLRRQEAVAKKFGTNNGNELFYGQSGQKKGGALSDEVVAKVPRPAIQ
jgi:transcriptional regulator with XRE-family HTH domain